MRRDSAPRREAGKGFALVDGTLAANGGGLTRPAGNCNELDFCIPSNGSHWDGGPHPSLNQSNNISGVGMSNQEIFSQRGAYLTPHPVNQFSPPIKARDGKGCNSSVDGLPLIPMVATGFHGDIARTLTARHDSSPCADRGMDVVAFGVSESPEVAHCLRSGASKADKHESTTYVVAPQQQIFGGNRCSGPIDIAPTRNASASASGRLDFESEAFVAIGLDEEQNPTEDFFGTLKARTKGGGFEGSVSIPGSGVRRLTPTECERLQGFPDGHTRIPWRGKPAEECPDGPRYKALGNSMAVPVMRWIGERISRFLV